MTGLTAWKIPEHGQEQGGSQAVPKAENVPKPDIAAREFIRDHIIIGRPEAAMKEATERYNGKGMRL